MTKPYAELLAQAEHAVAGVKVAELCRVASDRRIVIVFFDPQPNKPVAAAPQNAARGWMGTLGLLSRHIQFAERSKERNWQSFSHRRF